MSAPFPARFVFLPALVLAAGLALPAPLRGAAFPGDDARKKGADEAAKDDAKAEGRNDEKKEDKDQPKELPFDKVVKGAKTIQGLFNVFVNEDEAKFFLEIAPDQLEVPFLLNPTLVSGIGQGFIYPNDMLPEYVVAFHRNGKTIQLIHRNTLFRAGESSSMKRPAGVAAPDAIVGQAKIESRPHPDRKSLRPGVDLRRRSRGDGIGAEADLRGPLPVRQGRERRRLHPRLP